MSRSEGTWEKLSEVALKGAEYDSPERQPHPKCLKGTRVNLLDHTYELLDNPETSQFVWVHGTAGVGKSAVAFTVAERMRGQKMTEQRPRENRLAGTFFFSRKYEKRCLTGYFFATLAYQLASNFPSIRDDMTTAIHENPAVLDPKKSLRDQMEVLFLRPLQRLQLRLSKCPPVVFVVDALDECSSKAEIALLISLLGHALRCPSLPVTHILLTSRSEAHIRAAIHKEEVQPLVREIPVEISGKPEGVTSLISLDGADVDSDIYLFLKDSFTELRSRRPHFPQPTEHELERLANRAGRRFIVASTMMKFIDDGHNDSRKRLQLMLELTSKLLPSTAVHKLYDRILSTCADPRRAYQHLSIVSVLANPLPMSQILELLGGEGDDVETALTQLRSLMDIPTDRSLPVNIYHSSIRDYVSDPSNCGLPEVRHIIPPHSLLAYSSFDLMIREIPESTGLLEALLELKKQSRAMESHGPQILRDSLAFIVEPPTAMRVLIALLWLRGDRSPVLYSWLETPDGGAWLRTQGGTDWLETSGGLHWLQTLAGLTWLRSRSGWNWLQSSNGWDWLRSQSGTDWLQSSSGREWRHSRGGRDWIWGVRSQMSDLDASNAAEPWPHFEQLPGGKSWLTGTDWLHIIAGREWWLPTESVQEWLPTESVRELLSTRGGRQWLQTESGRQWLQTWSGHLWLHTGATQEWMQTQAGIEWLQTLTGEELLRTPIGREWLHTQRGRDWLQTHGGREWLQTPYGQAWKSTPAASFWVHMEEFLGTVKEVSKFMIIPELSLLPAFQAIQQFESLPDFLMFPAFLTLTPQSSTFALGQHYSSPDMKIIHVIKDFVSFTDKARERSRSAHDALTYACQNWAMHLSQAPDPWDVTLNHIFKVFWDNHLLPWLERQWCLTGLRSCLLVLSEGQKLAKENL